MYKKNCADIFVLLLIIMEKKNTRKLLKFDLRIKRNLVQFVNITKMTRFWLYITHALVFMFLLKNGLKGYLIKKNNNKNILSVLFKWTLNLVINVIFNSMQKYLVLKGIMMYVCVYRIYIYIYKHTQLKHYNAT